MSGFFLILSQDGTAIDDHLLETIAQHICFRGPDGGNLWKQNHLGSCFAFLQTGPAPQAIRQPVWWQDRFALWGDIRLDGRDDLIPQLHEIPVAQPASVSSEELLLRAWMKWGAVSLERIIGDFSFALWDQKEEVLYCARDFVGARPFFYASAAGCFWFTNTLPLLRRIPQLSLELDDVFVGDFLLAGWSTDPERTVYRDIKRLPGGHLLRIAHGNVEVRRFRKLPIEEPSQLEPQECISAYRSLLKKTVEDRLPEGSSALYLSGGLDSASVCAFAGQLAGAKNRKPTLKAFTLSWSSVFDDPEPAFARLTAEHLGIARQVIEQRPANPFETNTDEAAIAPEPQDQLFFARDRRNFRQIARHANVVLSGDGGDDILTGQSWPYLSHLWRQGEWKAIARDFGGYLRSEKRMPTLRGGFRAKLSRLLDTRDPFADYPAWISSSFETRAHLRDRWLEFKHAKKNTEHPIHPDAYFSLHRGFWSSVLETEDAGWNRVNLETRAPLLDLRLLQFLLRLPPVPWCMNKYLSRHAMEPDLPTAVLQRSKTPLVGDPTKFHEQPSWIESIPKSVSGPLSSFVNWRKWCETLYHFEGSVTGSTLRPACIFFWLKAVESHFRIE